MVDSDVPVLRVLRERLGAPRADEAAFRCGLLAAIGDTMGWSVGALWMPDADRERLSLVGEWRSRWHPGTAFIEESRGMLFARGEGLPGGAWATGEPAWITDVTEEVGFRRVASARIDGLRTGIAIPLLAQDGAVLGVLEFFSDRLRSSLPLLVELLREIGLTAGPAFTERGRGT